MRRRRFRWTRRLYLQADSLARFMSRHLADLPSEAPPLVRRYLALWERHPQHDDPLLRPTWQRYSNDSIPF